MTRLLRSTRLLHVFLFAFLATAFALAPVAQAQQAEGEAEDAPPPVFAQIDYMKVPPGQVGEYLSIEREIWKPLHQERASDGAILGWYLYGVRYPMGTSHDYQYVTVTLYDNLDDVENPQFGTYMERAHPNMDVSVAFERTTDARDLVRSELWFQHDEVAPETPPSEPAPFIEVDYMKVPPGSGSDYVSLEQDIFKPVHQARVDAETIVSWSLWQMMLPGGTSQRHNYGTVNAFQSISDIPGSYPEGVWEEVHPDRSLDEIFQQMTDTRDLVQMELWELVDYVPGSEGQTTSGR